MRDKEVEVDPAVSILTLYPPVVLQGGERGVKPGRPVGSTVRRGHFLSQADTLLDDPGSKL